MTPCASASPALFGFAAYLAVLKGALWATGETLALTHFIVEPQR